MKKKIVFNLDTITMAGLEKLAFEYIDILKDYYYIELIINENRMEDNYFDKYLPENIKLCYVVDNKLMRKLLYYKSLRRKNLYYNVMYNIYLYKKKKNFLKNIEKIINSKDYDLLVNFSLAIPGKLLKQKSLTWIQSSLEYYSSSRLKKIKDQLENTQNIIVISESMALEIKTLFPQVYSKVSLIYNSFDIEDIMLKSEKKEDVSESLKPLLNNNYILGCSRLVKSKDFITLIYAFSDFIKNSSLDYYLYLLGDGPERKNLENLVKKLKLENRVIFFGRIENPYIWMKNSKVFIHTSKSEGFGRVIVEAMICGVPVIATDCPVGPREILENGKNGILVEIGDYKNISKSVRKIIENNEFRDELLTNSFKRIEDFSKTKLTSVLLEKLNDIIDNK